MLDVVVANIEHYLSGTPINIPRRIAECADPDLLENWAARAATSTTAEMSPPPRPSQGHDETCSKHEADKSPNLVSDRLTYTYTHRHDRQAKRPRALPRGDRGRGPGVRDRRLPIGPDERRGPAGGPVRGGALPVRRRQGRPVRARDQARAAARAAAGAGRPGRRLPPQGAAADRDDRPGARVRGGRGPVRLAGRRAASGPRRPTRRPSSSRSCASCSPSRSRPARRPT